MVGRFLREEKLDILEHHSPCLILSLCINTLHPIPSEKAQYHFKAIVRILPLQPTVPLMGPQTATHCDCGMWNHHRGHLEVTRKE